MVTRVKICGIMRQEDADAAIRLGADALGFIFEPTSKRYLRAVPEWIQNLPPYVGRVAVFGVVPDIKIDPMFTGVQASGWLGSTTSEPKGRRIEAVRVRQDDRPQRILEQAQQAGSILLDAFVDGQYGGTGQTVDWSLAFKVVQTAGKPVILAGGLNPENVEEAIRKVRPYAVDVSSGVEDSPGVKSAEKIEAFLRAVLSADKRG